MTKSNDAWHLGCNGKGHWTAWSRYESLGKQIQEILQKDMFTKKASIRS